MRSLHLVTVSVAITVLCHAHPLSTISACGAEPATYAIKLKTEPSAGKGVLRHYTSKTDGFVKTFAETGEELIDQKLDVAIDNVYGCMVLEKGDELHRTFKHIYAKATSGSADGFRFSSASYQGRTVLFEFKDGKYHVTAEGKPELKDEALKSLAEEVNRPVRIENLLPRKPVVLGEAWPVNSKGLASVTLQPGAQIELADPKTQVKLTKVYQKDGKQCGIVELSGHLELKSVANEWKFDPPGVLDVTITIDGPIDGSSTVRTITGTWKLVGKGRFEKGAVKGAIAQNVTGSFKVEQSAEKAEEELNTELKAVAARNETAPDQPGAKREWKEFLSPDGKFWVSFPGTPRATTNKNKDGIDVEQIYSAWEENQQIVYAVKYARLNPKVTAGLDEKGRRKLLADQAAVHEKYIKSKREIRLGRYPGLEFNLEIEDKLTPERTVARYYLVHDYLYQVSVSCAKDKRERAQIAQFLDSFQVGEKKDEHFQTAFNGHANHISALAFASDGKTLASGSKDKTIKVWDLAAGREKFTLEGHEGEIHSVAFAADGKMLASASEDKTVRLWDTATGKQLAILAGHGRQVRSVAFMLDGKTVLSGSDDGTVRFWDVAAAKETKSFKHEYRVQAIALTRNGKTLAVACGDFKYGEVKLWDMVTGKEQATLKGHKDDVMTVAFSADGKMLASADSTGAIRLWEVSTAKELTSIDANNPNGISALVFAADGKTLIFGGRYGAIKVWDLSTKKFYILCNSALSVALAPDGKTLAAGSDTLVKLWDTEPVLRALAQQPELGATLKGHGKRIRSLAFTLDGMTLVSGSDDGTIREWGVGTGKERDVLKGHQGAVNSVAVGGRISLISGSADKTVKLWNLVTGKEEASLNDAKAAVMAVAWTHDLKVLAGGTQDGTIILWDMDPPKVRASLKACSGEVSCVAFTADGKTLASGGQDGLVKLWDVATGKEQAVRKGHAGFVMSLGFTPDGKTLASGGFDGTVKLWDVNTATERLTLGREAAEFVNSLAFDRDRKMLVSNHADKVVRVWDVESGKERTNLKLPDLGAACVAISPDGRSLAVGCLNGDIKLWYVPGVP